MRTCNHTTLTKLSTGELFCPVCLVTVSQPKEKPKKRSKYGSVRCSEDGINFDSIAERRYYRELKARKDAGEIEYFLMQVPFHLPGSIKYFCDFMVVENGGAVRYVDVKGVQTRVFINKKKQTEALYPVKIEVVKA